MGEMTRAQADLLQWAIKYGSMYCGYDEQVKQAARDLEDAGLGEIIDGTFGPELAATNLGRSALSNATTSETGGGE